MYNIVNCQEQLQKGENMLQELMRFGERSKAAKRILLIDEDRDFHKFFSQLFDQDVYHVTTCNDGDSAVNIAKKSVPDIIVLDVNMRRNDGFKVCGELKIDKEIRKIPVIILSARAKEYDKIIFLMAL